MSNRIPERNELDPKYMWNLTDLYVSDEAWYEDLEKLKTYPEKVSAFAGHLADSAQSMYDYIQLQEEAGKIIGSGIWLFGVFAAVLSVAMILAAPALAQLMHAPEEALKTNLH